VDEPVQNKTQFQKQNNKFINEMTCKKDFRKYRKPTADWGSPLACAKSCLVFIWHHCVAMARNTNGGQEV